MRVDTIGEMMRRSGVAISDSISTPLWPVVCYSISDIVYETVGSSMVRLIHEPTRRFVGVSADNHVDVKLHEQYRGYS